MYDSTRHGMGSIFYKLFVFGGLALLFAIPIVALIVTGDSTGYAMIPILEGVWLPALSLYLGGILAYQWWLLYFRVEMPPSSLITTSDDAAALADWNALYIRMALPGQDVLGVLRGVQRRSKRGMAVFMFGSTILALFPVAALWLGVFSFNGVSPIFPYFVAVYVLLALIAVPVFLFVGFRGAAEGDRLAQPLGLRITDLPGLGLGPNGPRVVGDTIMEGMRHGRPVRIDLGAGKYVTQIGGSFEPFTIKTKRGKFDTEPDTPMEVTEALRGIDAAKVWTSITVKGDSSGITVTRGGAQRAGTEWLYDLWLAERIAAQVGSPIRSDAIPA